MTELEIRKLLSDLPLHGVRFFEQVGSTNEVALAWAADGASDLSLVFADEQTHGRGRGDRHWYSPAGGHCLSAWSCDQLAGKPPPWDCSQLWERWQSVRRWRPWG
jgi:hypothetical protein